MSYPGHKEYLLNLKHAAFSSKRKYLFVNRGVDITDLYQHKVIAFGGAIKIF